MPVTIDTAGRARAPLPAASTTTRRAHEVERPLNEQGRAARSWMVSGVVRGEEVPAPVPSKVSPHGVNVVGVVLRVVVLE